MKPNNVIETFFSVQNPAIIVAVFFIVISAIVVLIKRDFITPLKNKVKELEEENKRLREKLKDNLKEE